MALVPFLWAFKSSPDFYDLSLDLWVARSKYHILGSYRLNKYSIKKCKYISNSDKVCIWLCLNSYETVTYETNCDCWLDKLCRKHIGLMHLFCVLISVSVLNFHLLKWANYRHTLSSIFHFYCSHIQSDETP